MEKFIAFIIISIYCLNTGCIHEFPHKAETDMLSPSVAVSLHLTFDKSFDTLKYITKSFSENDSIHSTEYLQRFIIEVHEKEQRITKQTIVQTLQNPDSCLTLPVILKLNASVYTLAIWTDYILKGQNEDLFYNTENLAYILLQEPYIAHTAGKECQYGILELDLQNYQNQQEAEVQAKINMKRPQAKYEFITTDVQDFIKKIIPNSYQKGTYYITFAHRFFIPAAFDILEGRVAESWSDISFTLPFHITDQEQKEACIGFDYLFADTIKNTCSVSILVKNNQGQTITYTPNITVPYKQGHLTTIRGNFLTPKTSGITINTEYDGEINIDLDRI